MIISFYKMYLANCIAQCWRHCEKTLFLFFDMSRIFLSCFSWSPCNRICADLQMHLNSVQGTQGWKLLLISLQSASACIHLLGQIPLQWILMGIQVKRCQILCKCASFKWRGHDYSTEGPVLWVWIIAFL